MFADGKPPLVLIADDSDVNLEAIGQVLEEAGYAIVAVRSGEEALAEAQRQRPDLVLLDMLMPGMDGRATCRALRAAGFADVPVICITGSSEQRVMVDAFSAGAVDYITKPFLSEELLARMRTHLDLKLARDRLAEMLRERDELMHIVAHDLKNPISATLFSAQLLGSCHDVERCRELIADIVGSSEQALQLIQRFLAGSLAGQRLRASSGEVIELREAAGAALHAQRAAAEARGMKLVVSGTALVQADGAITQSVIQSLVSNAIRYAPAQSVIEIEIGTSRTGQGRLLVLDRGPGLSEALREQLFRRYARLISADQHANPAAAHSSGIGLAIAKRDVLRMGGHLWYEPRSGGGAIFGIELPQRLQTADAA